jgi:hypothetical protein
MRLSSILPVLLLTTTSSAATFMSSMEAVTDVAERNYIGGPAAIARAMSAARHVGVNEHSAMRTRHQAKIAQWVDRDAEYVNMKYREFMASIAKQRAKEKDSAKNQLKPKDDKNQKQNQPKPKPKDNKKGRAKRSEGEEAAA